MLRFKEAHHPVQGFIVYENCAQQRLFSLNVVRERHFGVAKGRVHGLIPLVEERLTRHSAPREQVRRCTLISLFEVFMVGAFQWKSATAEKAD
jgi:hypothetical protein